MSLINAPQVLPPTNGPTPRQLSVRHRARGLPLRRAVWLAADAFFRFTHRANHANALWCRSEHVWLGSQTFLNWAMCDAHVDIPWLVAVVADAPGTAEGLHKAVRAELAAYWTEKLIALPEKSTPRWLALP